MKQKVGRVLKDMEVHEFMGATWLYVHTNISLSTLVEAVNRSKTRKVEKLKHHKMFPYLLFPNLASANCRNRKTK